MGQFFNAVTPPTGGSNHARRTPLPIGKQYVSHQGRQQKLRVIRQRTRTLRPSPDQTFRIGVYLKSQPWIDQVNPELARLFVLHHALCRSEELQLPFSDVLDATLDTLERETSDTIRKAMLGGAP